MSLLLSLTQWGFYDLLKLFYYVGGQISSIYIHLDVYLCDLTVSSSSFKMANEYSAVRITTLEHRFSFIRCVQT